MKIFKLKSTLLSLIAITIVTAFLSSCETDDTSIELKENANTFIFEDVQTNATKYKKVIKLSKANAKSPSNLTLVVQSENAELLDKLTAADFEIESTTKQLVQNYPQKAAKNSNYDALNLDIEGKERIEVEIINDDNVTSDFKGYNIHINPSLKKSTYYVITAHGGNRSTAYVFNNSFDDVSAGNNYSLCRGDYNEFTYSKNISANGYEIFRINSNQVENHVVKVYYYSGFISIGYFSAGYCNTYGSCYYESIEEGTGPQKMATKAMSLFAAKEMKESINLITGLYLNHKQELLNLYTNNAQVKQAIENYYDTYVEIANNGFSKNPSALTKAEIESTIELLKTIEVNSSEQLQNSVERLKQEVKSFEGKTLTEGFEAFNVKHQ